MDNPTETHCDYCGELLEKRGPEYGLGFQAEVLYTVHGGAPDRNLIEKHTARLCKDCFQAVTGVAQSLYFLIEERKELKK